MPVMDCVVSIAGDYSSFCCTVFCSFQLLEDLFSSPHYTHGHACQLRYVHAVASTDTARCYPVQEDDLTLFISANCHCVDAEAREFFRHGCQFMIMGGKERPGCRHVVQMLDNCSRNRQPIVSTCTSTDFIQDNQAMSRGMIQDGGSFFHLDHKRTFAGGDIIFRADTRKNAIYQPNAGTTRGHKTADLC